jgi:hypothetical protein
VDPRIDKICELGKVIISAAYMFQSMPDKPDGSEEEVEEVCLSALIVVCYTHRAMARKAMARMPG